MLSVVLVQARISVVLVPARLSVLYAGNCAGKVEPRSKVPLAHQKVKKKYIFFHVQICLVMLLIVGLFAWVIIQLVNNLKH